MYLIYFKNQNRIQKIFANVFFLLFFLACDFIFSVKIFAQGNLLIVPKRVVFEGVKKSQEINLANIGKDTATYFISFTQLRMKQDGSVENITKPDSGQYFADAYLRYFPRKVTLAPNEAQTIKLQVTKSKSLPDGEYRSHLYFRAEPTQNLLGTAEEPVNDSSISIKITPIFGISIPAIMLVGNCTAEVNLSNFLFHIDKDTTPYLQMALSRFGNKSVYGDIRVDHIADDGKITHVGIINGVAVYSPMPLRLFTLPLQKRADVNYHSGKLHVVYQDQSQKPVELAKGEVVLK
jgi:hypothetical protein